MQSAMSSTKRVPWHRNGQVIGRFPKWYPRQVIQVMVTWGAPLLRHLHSCLNGKLMMNQWNGGCPLNVTHMGYSHQQWGRGFFLNIKKVFFSPRYGISTVTIHSTWLWSSFLRKTGLVRPLKLQWLRVSSAVQEYANNMKHDYDDLFYVRKCSGLKLWHWSSDPWCQAFSDKND